MKILWSALLHRATINSMYSNIVMSQCHGVSDEPGECTELRSSESMQASAASPWSIAEG